MLDYPNEFDTPTFPAGPRIALSRTVSIVTMVVFLLIVLVCGVLLWAQRSAQVHPFLVSVNNITGQWNVVGHHHSGVLEMSANQALQESVIGKFLRNWYFISGDASRNGTLWQSCDRIKECSFSQNALTDISENKCALYCVASDELYTDFTQKIIPQYNKLYSDGIEWSVDMPSLQITKIETSDNQNLWQVRIKINTNASLDQTEILGFVRLGINVDVFPTTMGYYVSEFNAYKMN